MRIVFQGVSAFVGRVDGEYRCGFWVHHPHEVNYDPVLLLPVNLGRTPSRAAAGAIDWDQVVVDDHVSTTGGRTSIGPTWPGSPTVGAAYLSEAYISRLRADLRPPAVPPGFEDEAYPYEFKTCVYSNSGRTTKRYYGFHGEIISEVGNVAQVALYNAGSSRISQPRGVFPIVLDKLDEVDANVDQGGMTVIGAGAGKPKSGAIFLSAAQRQVVPLDFPKIPKSAQE